MTDQETDAYGYVILPREPPPREVELAGIIRSGITYGERGYAASDALNELMVMFRELKGDA